MPAMVCCVRANASRTRSELAESFAQFPKSNSRARYSQTPRFPLPLTSTEKGEPQRWRPSPHRRRVLASTASRSCLHRERNTDRTLQRGAPRVLLPKSSALELSLSAAGDVLMQADPTAIRQRVVSDFQKTIPCRLYLVDHRLGRTSPWLHAGLTRREATSQARRQKPRIYLVILRIAHAPRHRTCKRRLACCPPPFGNAGELALVSTSVRWPQPSSQSGLR
jgi:hypothetical protein